MQVIDNQQITPPRTDNSLYATGLALVEHFISFLLLCLPTFVGLFVYFGIGGFVYHQEIKFNNWGVYPLLCV